MVVGCGSRFVRDPVRRRQAGKTRLALLDFANAQISRVASLGTSCRVRVPLSSCFSSLFVPSSAPLSLSLPLFLSLSLSHLLAARFSVRRNVNSSPRRSCLPPSSSILPAVDRPSVSVPIREHSRIPPHCVSHLPLFPSRSRTPATDTHARLLARDARTTRLLVGRGAPRGSESGRKQARQRARWTRHRRRPRRRESITCQTQRTCVKLSIVSVRGTPAPQRRDVPPSEEITRFRYISSHRVRSKRG